MLVASGFMIESFEDSFLAQGFQLSAISFQPGANFFASGWWVRDLDERGRALAGIARLRLADPERGGLGLR
jgi:hypothetical protein